MEPAFYLHTSLNRNPAAWLADVQLSTGGCAPCLVFSSGSKCGLEPRGSPLCRGDAVGPQGCK